MDMKKILQALDTASTKPVEGSNDMKKFLSVVSEADLNQPVAAPAQQGPEQIAYNQLRAQLDSADSLRGGANTYTDVSPEVTASTTAMRTKLAQMAAALKAKGIDAEAEYDAPDPAVPAASPVDLNQKYNDQPVAEDVGMSRLLSILSEGKNPHKVTLPVQMAMQHYQKPKEDTPVEIVESVFKTYVAVVEDNQHQQELARQAAARQYGRKVAESVMKKAEQRQLDELSTELLGNYKKAAYADAKKADSEGDYARGNKRFKGINNATKKQFDNDLKKHKLTIEELEEAIKELKK